MGLTTLAQFTRVQLRITTHSTVSGAPLARRGQTYRLAEPACYLNVHVHGTVRVEMGHGTR
jgi:hypothetical protein